MVATAGLSSGRARPLKGWLVVTRNMAYTRISETVVFYNNGLPNPETYHRTLYLSSELNLRKKACVSVPDRISQHGTRASERTILGYSVDRVSPIRYCSFSLIIGLALSKIMVIYIPFHIF